ncbi:MAG TPA: NrfD/PsrC family molybdoenzyme membrane anchor subunit [Anaerolineae bacterium]|nr:NrfD/PsrC family molybdoenzyme membrane anchor subunit [Anaerolineae bacterium]
MNEERPGAGYEAILRPLEQTGWRFYLFVAILLAMIGLGVYAYSLQLRQGLAVTGMNRPVFWGLYITNFVFFIGLSHAGTLISAILRILGAEWRRPFTRLAEAVTVFSLPFGVGSILIDLGRIDRLINVVRYARFQSPMLWDVTAVSTYMTSSIIFFYIAMIPDIALLRDRYPDAPAWRRHLYRVLALGWKGTPEQNHRLEKIMGAFAIFLTLLVVTVHTVVSWIFGMTIVPGWHSAIIGPYFLVGAIFCGVAAVAVVAAILRWVLGLQEYLTPKHFDYLGRFLVALTLAWIYFTFAEFLTTIYGSEPAHMAVFWAKFREEFSLALFLMVFFCAIVPLPKLAWRRTRTIFGIVIACISINIGMWMERWTVIVPSLARPRLPYSWGTYSPTWIEWAIMAACFAGLLLLYTLFAKLFPVIAIWEIEEAAHAPAQTDVSIPSKMPEVVADGLD